MTRIILFLFLMGLLLFRIWQVWPLDRKQSESGFEGISGYFTPWRKELASHIYEILPTPQGPLLAGILLGEKTNIPKDLTQALQNTSTIHIAVVSGQNLSMLAGFILTLAPLLGRKKMIVAALSTSLLYAFLTGFQVPVIRALVMVVLVFAAQLFGRENDSFWALMVTGLVMLSLNPNWAFSISFQLSFAATLAVVRVAPLVVANLAWLPEVMREDLGVSLAAQALTLPIIAANFHQLSMLGVIVNALVLWTISPIMLTGLMALVASLIWPPLGWTLGIIPNIFLMYFLQLVNWFDSIPFNKMYIPTLPVVVWAGYYLLLFGAYLRLKQRGQHLAHLTKQGVVV
ncbi:hypothetical protein A2631_01045 [Candidatus Daviesbacteria bacterium RIFCSPHIGHO2_01_FULL_44_29]|nr:MAG: hypothetical protein A2631_01045 [Candidatus Daviesbacteria bacterium RIFCSPHIGHO2_01_FULL_44_29]OGE40428.1 MAG: hypothetical protein A3E86_03240 [Candidatus Daviesbacteria bacterium RIFCSPHIGHO2_12_FULL_47_45]OGE69765.1 MAG: hypothetical protein A3B55_05110 [Candidatus Daviesbacteria bacterium RIFCSPLOWO2_01_FULL_43_15]